MQEKLEQLKKTFRIWSWWFINISIQFSFEIIARTFGCFLITVAVLGIVFGYAPIIKLKGSYILRRPQNLKKKYPTFFGNYLVTSKQSWRFLWPLQNIWTLWKLQLLDCQTFPSFINVFFMQLPKQFSSVFFDLHDVVNGYGFSQD